MTTLSRVYTFQYYAIHTSFWLTAYVFVYSNNCQMKVTFIENNKIIGALTNAYQLSCKVLAWHRLESPQVDLNYANCKNILW